MIRKCRQKKTAGNQLLLKYRAGIPSDRRYLATVRRLMWMPWFVRCSAISRSLIAFESVPDWSSNATAPVRHGLESNERPGDSRAPHEPGHPHQSTNGCQVSSVTWNPCSILQEQLIPFCFLLAAFAYHVYAL